MGHSQERAALSSSIRPRIRHSTKSFSHFHMRPGGGYLERFRDDSPAHFLVEFGGGDAGVAPELERVRVAEVAFEEVDEGLADAVGLVIFVHGHSPELPGGAVTPGGGV